MDAIPFLDIPFVSVVFFFGAGILAGHLLWYRDRSDDEASLIGLRAENSDLQDALHQHKQAYTELEAQFEDHRKEWERFKSASQQLEQANYESEREIADMQTEVTRLQQLKDQAFHDLDQERQQRRALQEALSVAEQESSRSQSINEQLQSETLAFKAQLAKINEIHQVQSSQLTETVDQLTQQRDSLAAERDLAGSELRECQLTLERVQQELQHRDSDLESLRSERDEFRVQVEDERQAREQLGTKATQVDQLVIQRDEALERCNATERKLDVVISQRDEAMDRWATAEKDCQQLQAQLEDRSEVLRLEQAHTELLAAHAALQNSLAELKVERDTVEAACTVERARLAQLERQHQQLWLKAAEQQEANSLMIGELREVITLRESELTNLRTELEELAAQLARERHQREHLQAVLDRRRTETEQLHREQEQLVAQLREITTQNESLVEQSNELSALRGEHASVVRMIEQQTDAMTAAKSEINLAVTAKREAEHRIEQLQRTVNLLEASQDGYVEEVEVLRDRLTQANQWKQELATHRERIEKLSAQRDELADAKAAIDAEVSHLKQELDAQGQSLSTVHQQHDQLQQKLQLETERYQQVCAELDEQRHQHRHLEEESRCFEELREEYLELKSRLNETSEQIRSVSEERDKQRATALDLQQQLVQLERRNQSNEDTIRNLRRERGVVLTRVRQPGDRFGEFPTADHEAGGRLRRDEILGLVYTQPPKRKDDLKKISGIAQVLEKKLNAFGIYTYRQVMEWDAVAIAEFSKLLSFRDRISRDDWVGQARSLHYDSYGRAA